MNTIKICTYVPHTHTHYISWLSFDSKKESQEEWEHWKLVVGANVAQWHGSLWMLIFLTQLLWSLQRSGKQWNTNAISWQHTLLASLVWSCISGSELSLYLCTALLSPATTLYTTGIWEWDVPCRWHRQFIKLKLVSFDSMLVEVSQSQVLRLVMQSCKMILSMEWREDHCIVYFYFHWIAYTVTRI